MTTIYCHRNKIDGKRYIGQTNRPIEQRWGYKGNGYRTCRKFRNAIAKYGWDNFDHIVICTCEDWESDILEREFIKKYDSVRNGYNLEFGGKRNIKCSEETRKLLSQREKGRKVSEYTRSKMSAMQKGKHYSQNTEFKKGHSVSLQMRKRLSDLNKGKPSHFKGIKLSEERKQHLREINAKYPVLQYTKDGNLVREWNSISGASRELHIDKSHISNCCKRKTKYKSAGGFIWRYKHES